MNGQFALAVDTGGDDLANSIRDSPNLRCLLLIWYQGSVCSLSINL